MAIVKGTNSYVTVAEADAYHAYRVGGDVWTASSNPVKERALVTATQMLDNMNWAGTAVSDDQFLAFPRYGSYFDPKLGMDVELDEFVPVRIETANSELALHLIKNDSILDGASSVKNISIGDITLTGINAAPTIPGFVKSFIRPLLNGGANLWWRAN